MICVACRCEFVWIALPVFWCLCWLGISGSDLILCGCLGLFGFVLIGLLFERFLFCFLPFLFVGLGLFRGGFDFDGGFC